MSPPRLMVPVDQPPQGSVRPPGSKSLTNRALIVSALSNGKTQLQGVLDSLDTQVMIESLKRLQFDIQANLDEQRVDLIGKSGLIPASQADLFLENSGTSIRFLTALCALGTGTFRLDGSERMRQRPIEDLVEALEQLGVDVRCELGTGCPPVLVQGKGLQGGSCRIKGGKSSQFLSALLMAAPCAGSALDIIVEGELVSEPYADMTLGVMAQFGVEVSTPRPGHYRVTPQSYQSREYEIEPDASAASYFFATAAITGGTVRVEGLNRWSLQGDVRFVDALEQMGCDVAFEENSIRVRGKPLKGIEIDMNAISDTAQTLAVVAPFAQGPTRIYNVSHMRFKETDRLFALSTELRKLGLSVEETNDSITIFPGEINPATIATYDDHRMAMSFALIGLKVPGIQIANPECTGKTYPKFFEDLDRLCGR